MEAAMRNQQDVTKHGSDPSDGGRVETVIVGGGQAGLAVGYHLARRDRPFLILDADQRAGDAWRRRWDSLRLFTPARYSGLPGWPFPAPPFSHPTRDEVADYLEAYAARFDLPVRNGVGWTGSPEKTAASWWWPATAAGRPNRWWWPAAPTNAPGSPPSPPSSTRASSSWTSPGTGTPPSCAPAGCWWWGPATPGPRSPTRSRAPTRPGCRAPTPATSRSAPAAAGTT